MLIYFVILLLVICSSRCLITCPKSSWTEYKKIEEGPWSFFIPDNREVEANVYIERNTEYWCHNRNNVLLRTTRKELYRLESQENNYIFRVNDYDMCFEECVNKSVNVKVFYRNWLGWLTRWSKLKPLGEFVYLNKNCNKFYWTTWTEILNCSSTDYSVYGRQCADCDGGLVDLIYCTGDYSRKDKCHHFWSEWVAVKSCKVTECNLTGNRKRKRQCLYGEGIVADNYQLCPHFNKSDVIIEQCGVSDLPRKCLYHWNEWSKSGPCIISGCNLTGKQIFKRKCLRRDGSEAPDNKSCSNTSLAEKVETCKNTNLALTCTQSLSNSANFTGIYVGIGVAATLTTFGLFILLALVKWRHFKSEQLLSRGITNHANKNFSPREMETENQSNTSANERIQIVESNVYFQKKETLPNVYESIQPEESIVYEQIMPSANQSNTSFDCKNQQPIVKSMLLYSRVQKTGEQKEQTSVYSTLDKPIYLQDSKYYSSLGQR